MAKRTMNDEQRKHWNDYNSKYARENYKCYNLKMSKDNDQDVINYFNSQTESPAQVVRRLVRKELGTGK